MTAYEMRISGWSSDVCSSDLLERQAFSRECWIQRKVRGTGLEHREDADHHVCITRHTQPHQRTGVDAARVQQPREAVGAGIEGGIVHDSLAITNRDPRWRSIDLRLDQRVNWRFARVRHGRLLPQ